MKIVACGTEARNRRRAEPRPKSLQNDVAMSIVLVGYRGSGKTTLGRLLAGRLRMPFIDLDETVVNRAGMTIKQIFDRGGEAMFRRFESAALVEILAQPGHVLSLGGGAILATENRGALLRSGHHVVYLRANPAELHRRIMGDPATAANRPNLTGLGGGIAEIESLLARRDPLYREVMSCEVDVTEKTPSQLLDDCERLVEKSRAGKVAGNEN